MIASLTGKVQYIASDRCVVDVSGVGYEVFLSSEGVAGLPERGNAVFLHIHTNVREDAIVLFGFAERDEKEMFLTLKTVSGIGPKLALAILSGMQLGDLGEAIATENIKGLTTISGVGKKTAERICVELKDKVGDFRLAGSRSIDSETTTLGNDTELMDALSALVNLGYADSVARDALGSVKKQIGDETFAVMKVEELIREGLRALA